MKDNIFTVHENMLLHDNRLVLGFNGLYWNIDKDDLEDLTEAMEQFSIDPYFGWEYDRHVVGPVIHTFTVKTHPELFI